MLSVALVVIRRCVSAQPPLTPTAISAQRGVLAVDALEMIEFYPAETTTYANRSAVRRAGQANTEFPSTSCPIVDRSLHSSARSHLVEVLKEVPDLCDQVQWQRYRQV